MEQETKSPQKSSITVTKVSTHKVVPLTKKDDGQEKKVKASDWFALPYPNMFLLAMKNSGKTTVIENILKRKAGKYTKFLFFSSTIHKDKTWKSILETYNDRDVIAETSFILPDGTNMLEEFMTERKDEAKDDMDKPIEAMKEQIIIKKTVRGSRSKPVVIKGDWSSRSSAQKVPIPKEELTDEQKVKKSKVIYPAWIIVIDDLSGEMSKSSALERLLKTNRHFSAMVIISSQSLNDLNPRQIGQLEYVLLFSKIPDEKLKETYEKLAIYLPWEEFYKLYRDATSEKYSFLYVGRGSDGIQYRKGFTDKYEIADT